MSADTDDQDALASWDLTPPILPPRTRLFRLAPAGVGTPEIEGVASYTSRLAAEHSVTTGTLVRAVIAPLVRADFFIPGQGLGGRGSRAVASTGHMASDWAGGLEALTGQVNLRALTMLPLRDIVADRELLRLDHSWCPACYQEMADHGGPVWDPLAWSLMTVGVCSRHHRVLTTRCPAAGCGRTMRPISTLSRPGFCAHCGWWLGSSREPGEAEVVRHERAAYLYAIAEQARGVVAQLDQLEASVDAAAVYAALAALVERLGASTLADAMGCAKATPLFWRSNRRRATLVSLTTLAFCLGTRLVDILREPAKLAAASVERYAPGALAVPGTKRFAGKNNWDSVAAQQLLEEAVAADGRMPPSLAELARRCGVAISSLRIRFPALTAELVARRAALRVQNREAKAGDFRTRIRAAIAERRDAGLGIQQRATLQAAGINPYLMRDTEFRKLFKDLIHEATEHADVASSRGGGKLQALDAATARGVRSSEPAERQRIPANATDALSVRLHAYAFSSPAQITKWLAAMSSQVTTEADVTALEDLRDRLGQRHPGEVVDHLVRSTFANVLLAHDQLHLLVADRDRQAETTTQPRLEGMWLAEQWSGVPSGAGAVLVVQGEDEPMVRAEAARLERIAAEHGLVRATVATEPTVLFLPDLPAMGSSSTGHSTGALAAEPVAVRRWPGAAERPR